VLADEAPIIAGGNPVPDVTYEGPEEVRGGDARARGRESSSGSEAVAVPQLPLRGELPADVVGSNDEAYVDETAWVPVVRKATPVPVVREAAPKKKSGGCAEKEIGGADEGTRDEKRREEKSDRSGEMAGQSCEE
jgi:hypothetical protein